MKVLVLSDIHANEPALQGIQEMAKVHGRVAGIWFLGDLFGYGPHAEEVAQWFLHRFRESGEDLLMWVPGNHDVALLKWAEQKNLNSIARETLQNHIQQLQSSRMWEAVQGMFRPRVREFLTPGEKITDGLPHFQTADTVWFLSHGGVYPVQARVSWYLYPWSQETWNQLRLLEEWRQRRGVHRVVVLVGHTHFPMAAWMCKETYRLRDLPYHQWIELEEGTWLLNPGSVGLPRDGDIRAAFMVFDIENTKLWMGRVEYDWRATLQDIWFRYPPELAEPIGKWITPQAPQGDEKWRRYREYYEYIPSYGLKFRMKNR